MSAIGAKIARIANGYVGSASWKYDAAKGDFPAKTNKCNQFVADVAAEAGAPASVSKYVFWSRPPTAGEWADAGTSISGWTVVTDPQPGDVVAEAHNYSDATGHCGIVRAVKETISASSLVGGVITNSDWGFRGDSKPTFRRYTG